jgi:hypothetical protein
MALLESSGVVVVVPGVPLAPNMAVAADTSAGSPPRTFTFRGTFDGNDNGQDETRLDGRVTYANDPSDFFAGFNGATGSVTADVNILGLLHVYHGDIGFSFGASEHRLTGSGTFTNPVNGVATTLAISSSDPLVMKLADGSATARANACGHSLSGSAQLTVAGSGGSLTSLWRFSNDSTAVAVTNQSFTDSSGATTALPDAQLELGCGSAAGSINDWTGRFRIRWACLPHESGEFNTTITVKNGTTVQMIDDGDTAASAYEASLVGASSRAIRGFFIDGPAGSRYREDFNWVLNLNGSGFTQTSRYKYFEGPQAGRGGICAARATRIS